MSIHPPTPPRFPLRHLAHVAYAMSVTVGGLGQVLFLGERFGGTPAGWIAACGLAAFAEVCMVACGDWSLEHRSHGRSWLILLILGLLVSGYAAGLNASHWWHTSRSLAVMFAGASMIGFLLHVTNGHIRVTAYLSELDEYQSRTKVAERAAEISEQAQDRSPVPPASTETDASTEPGTHPVRTEQYPGTDSGTPASTEPADDTPVIGLRLVAATSGTSQPAQTDVSTKWEPELWDRAVSAAHEYRAENQGADVTVTALQTRLSIGRGRALELRRDVLEFGLGTPASTAGPDESGTEPVPAYAGAGTSP